MRPCRLTGEEGVAGVRRGGAGGSGGGATAIVASFSTAGGSAALRRVGGGGARAPRVTPLRPLPLLPPADGAAASLGC